MKRIIIACGSGVATSTVANQKVSAYLDEHGYSGKYQIEQCQNLLKKVRVLTSRSQQQ